MLSIISAVYFSGLVITLFVMLFAVLDMQQSDYRVHRISSKEYLMLLVSCALFSVFWFLTLPAAALLEDKYKTGSN